MVAVGMLQEFWVWINPTFEMSWRDEYNWTPWKMFFGLHGGELMFICSTWILERYSNTILDKPNHNSPNCKDVVKHHIGVQVYEEHATHYLQISQITPMLPPSCIVIVFSFFSHFSSFSFVQLPRFLVAKVVVLPITTC
jgi:hypothetical protein